MTPSDLLIDQPVCRNCEVPMDAGWMPDILQGIRQQTWSPGQPEIGFIGNVKKPGPEIAVLTFRCPECGLLESYARKEFKAKRKKKEKKSKRRGW